MSNPLHAIGCPCFSCHTQRNPRALAPDYALALGEDSVLHRVPLAPEPLYPRAPTSGVEAELRKVIADLEAQPVQSEVTRKAIAMLTTALKGVR